MAVIADLAPDGAGVDVRRQHRNAPPLRFVNQRVGRIEPHRLLVEQRAQELGPVVLAQPRRLVGQQPERRAVRLGEAEAREARDHRPHALGQRFVDVGMPRHRSRHEAVAVGLDRRLRALARHRPPQSLGLARREAGERPRSLDHLVLEDDRAECLAQHGLQARVVIGHLEVRVHALALLALDVGVDRAADDRPGAHDRHLDRQVLERLGPRAPQRAHLRTALDLEDAGGVGLLDRLVRGWVVVGDSRKVDPLAAPRRDHLDAALDRREHPQSEQVDLQEARVAAGVLVPHDHLPALHRGGHDGAAVDQGASGDDHPARVL